MDETIKQNIMKVVTVVIMFILLLCTITANSKYGKLEKEVDGYKYEITTLEEDITEKDTLIENYKKTDKEQKETISKLNESIDELESKVENLTTKNNTLNKEITTLKAEIETSNNTITTLQETITKLNKSNETNLLTIEDLSNQLETSNNKVTTLTTTNTNLNNEVKELQNKLKTINTYYVVNSEIELLEALKKDGNIILNTDIIMSNEVVIKDKNLSIDLNGHNLVVTAIQLNNTNLETKDSKSTGKISIVGDNEDKLKGIKVDNTSTLKITNGNYEGKNLFQVEGTLYGVNPTLITAKDDTIVKGETSKVELFNYPVIVD